MPLNGVSISVIGNDVRSAIFSITVLNSVKDPWVSVPVRPLALLVGVRPGPSPGAPRIVPLNGVSISVIERSVGVRPGPSPGAPTNPN